MSAYVLYIWSLLLCFCVVCIIFCFVLFVCLFCFVCFFSFLSFKMLNNFFVCMCVRCVSVCFSIAYECVCVGVSWCAVCVCALFHFASAHSSFFYKIEISQLWLADITCLLCCAAMCHSVLFVLNYFNWIETNRVESNHIHIVFRCHLNVLLWNSVSVSKPFECHSLNNTRQ